MTAQGEDILAWLNTAIDRREQAALHAFPGPWKRDYHAAFMHGITAADARPLLVQGLLDSQNVHHIIANDPTAVLRRCAADRKLLELHGGRMHSCPAKDETGYLDEWTQFSYDDVCPVVQLLAEGYGWTEGER